MNKEEAKQHIRNQINSGFKIQHTEDEFCLYYNNSYLRALKLSKITGKSVNTEIFKGSEPLFYFKTKTKKYIYYSEIGYYLHDNYSESYSRQKKIIEEVFNEYDEYKGYDFM